jgi:hypothetical protein
MSRSHGHQRSSRAYLQLVHDTTAPVAPMTGAPASGRRRIEIIPLDGTATEIGTTTASPRSEDIPRLAPTPTVGDRRQNWPGRDVAGDPSARLVCRSCAIPARVDVVDLRNKRLHLSCDRCFRMWQDQVREGDTVPSGLQRVR